MNKKTIITALLALVTMTGQAQTYSELSDDWQNVQYAQDETLPDAKINKGIATIKVKLLGYKPDMKKELYVLGFKPLGSKEQFEKEFPFADDGTLTAEIPVWMAREVRIGIGGITYPNEDMAFPSIIIAPGQKTEILMKVTDGQECPFVAFKGYMAKTNMDLQRAYDVFTTYRDDEKTYLKVKECKTKEERLQCLTEIFNQRIADVKGSNYTTAAKDLLCMEAERHFVEWTRNFANTYSRFVVLPDGRVTGWNDHYLEDCKKNRDMLSLSLEERDYSWKYLNEPTSPCSSAFWSANLLNYDKKAKEKNVHNIDLIILYSVLSGIYAGNVNFDNEGNAKCYSYIITSKDCSNVIREYQAEQQRIGQLLASQESVFYQKYNDVPPEDILQTILDKYKGKAVLIDMWETWCGPCRQGHKLMKPIKEEMSNINVQFVYLASPKSQLNTWQEIIKDIEGDHYYLTEEQYNYILGKYESDGIPTYAIYDAHGQLTFKNTGFPGIDCIKAEIEKALNNK